MGVALRGTLLLAGLGLLIRPVAGQQSSEPLKFERLFPAAVAVGTHTKLTAEGKFPTWPAQVYCDRSDLKIECDAASGQLNIEVPATAPVGIAWLRLYDHQHVSGLIPLLIEAVEVTMEQEPNDALDTARQVPLPVVVCGKLEKNEDVDGVRVALEPGQPLVATVIANRLLQSDMDAVLQITNLAGQVLAQADDEIGLDPQLIYATDEPVQVIVRLFAFPETPNSTIGFAGAASYSYALRLSQGPVADHFLPLLAAYSQPPPLAFGWNLERMDSQWTPASEISPRIASAPSALGWQWIPALEEPCQSILEGAAVGATSLPAVFSGHILTADEVDKYRFPARAGQKLRAVVYSREFGFPLDSVLRIVDPTQGTLLARNDDAARNDYDAAVEFSPTANAELELQISDLASAGSPRHAYSVHVAEIEPSVSLALASDRFALKSGGELEVNISIARTKGFDKKLRLTATGLPPGVRAEAVDSEATGDSAKAVKLKLMAAESAPAFQGQFQIMAGEVPTAEQSDSTRQLAARYQLRSQVLVDQLWLTLTGP